MRAAQVSKLEGPEAIRIVDIPEPAVFPGGVVIDVHAAGVAFPDVLMTRGLYQMKPELPFVVGGEVAGIVREAPEDAHVRPGDRVVALTMLGNAMAETAVTPTQMVFRLPDNVSLEAGAGILFNDLTVHFCLRTRGRLAEGETVLVHGAAGGIGTSTLRLAAALGAGRVIAVVSTEEKAEVARANGATDVVLTDGWLAAVKELTGGRGVDIVLDPVGGDRFTDSIRSLASAGRLLVVGFTAGEIPTVKVNRLLLKNVEVTGAA
jgi:NADPH2:quinone reductase